MSCTVEHLRAQMLRGQVGALRLCDALNESHQAADDLLYPLHFQKHRSYMRIFRTPLTHSEPIINFFSRWWIHKLQKKSRQHWFPANHGP